MSRKAAASVPKTKRNVQKVFEQRAVSDPSLTSHIRSQHFETDFGALQDRIQGAVQRERNSRHGRRHAPEVDRPPLDGLTGHGEAVKSMADRSLVT